MSYLWAFLVLGACTEQERAPSPAVQFADVAQKAGLVFEHYNGFSGEYYYVETFGSGAAFFDYDGDGRQDIYLVNGTYLRGEAPDPLPGNRLYRNTGGGLFADVTAASGSGDSGYGMGCAAGDYDNDGDQDLYVTNFGANALYRNEGNGRFYDIADTVGVGDKRWGSSSGFLDYDNDGDLDLFVVNYVNFELDSNVICQQGKVRSYCEPNVYEPTGDVLYRNDGESGFTDITDEVGLTLKGRGLGLAFADYDDDGDTDLYVANDGTMNFLYANRQGRFVEVGLEAGTHYNAEGRAEAGMGVDFGDSDGDGDQDLFVTNFSFETNTLYRNEGQGQFRDATMAANLATSTFRPLGFGTKFFDYDNDGDVDLFVANGHVMDRIDEIEEGHTYAQTNQVLDNEGRGHFTDVSQWLGPHFVSAAVSRAVAVADYDDDGDVDVLVTNVSGSPALLRNDGGNEGHWLQIYLVGQRQRDALGARVVVTAGGRRQVRERQSGGSYLASHDPRLHFGLGAARQADIEVRWPDGAMQSLSNVETDRVIHLVQSSP
jgi:hypothetical protein